MEHAGPSGYQPPVQTYDTNLIKVKTEPVDNTESTTQTRYIVCFSI